MLYCKKPKCACKYIHCTTIEYVSGLSLPAENFMFLLETLVNMILLTYTTQLSTFQLITALLLVETKNGHLLVYLFFHIHSFFIYPQRKPSHQNPSTTLGVLLLGMWFSFKVKNLLCSDSIWWWVLDLEAIGKLEAKMGIVLNIPTLIYVEKGCVSMLITIIVLLKMRQS